MVITMADCLTLKKSNCKNCYKCIRHCPVKSIRFSGNQAYIIGNECILCGQCFVVCPQNAKQIVANGTKYYLEGANMPATPEAIEYMQQHGVIVAPGKASNAGGVSVSGLEMSQNSERLSWSADEVDAKLHNIMKSIHDASAAAAAEYGLGYDLVAGANLAGFKKVAEAMIAQGVI